MLRGLSFDLCGRGLYEIKKKTMNGRSFIKEQC